MSLFRRSRVIVTLVLVLFGFFGPRSAFAEERTSNSTTIEFPIGDIEMRYLESIVGMLLDVESGPFSIRTRRRSKAPSYLPNETSSPHFSLG